MLTEADVNVAQKGKEKKTTTAPTNKKPWYNIFVFTMDTAFYPVYVSGKAAKNFIIENDKATNPSY